MGQWAWYAVQKGRQPGLYRTWDECAAQVKGFASARFKGFNTREGAESYVRGGNTGVTGGGVPRVMGVSSSAPPTSASGLSTTATPSSSAAPRPGSSAPARGMIGISAEVMSSLLNLDPPSTPARSTSGLSTTSSISSSTPRMTVNGLSAAPRTINGLSPTPELTSSTPTGSIITTSRPPAPAPAPAPPAPAPPAPASALISSTPASSPSPKFYAVAAGRSPGVYLTWRECEAQIRGVSGARYKSFRTRAEAVEFLAVHGGGGHFSQFEADGFRPDRGASFSDEFGRLSSSQGWVPGSQRYQEERVRALHNELRTHYFSSIPTMAREEEQNHDVDGPLHAVKKEKGNHLIKEEDEEEEEEDENENSFAIREQLLELQCFQNLCREVGKAPADSREGCRSILKETFVNIVDLIDARRIGAKIEVWADFEEFRRYTLQNHKTMPYKQAEKYPLLECFLQRILHPDRSAARGSRRRRRLSSSSDGMSGHESKRRLVG
ncbi:hypothetical protein VSDG_05340 [Cytospora chrysosperma]|uniref:Ribonuclease H n=1 Tax=Cytospora chrysosperma TaxID=252740 RepID=A0A423VWX4_CYTCH|nr:hypothetical protein VSDG_05340 [Valsa sordida]